MLRVEQLRVRTILHRQTLMQRALLLVALMFLGSQSAYSQELWQGTRYGMTVDEVQRQIPGTILAISSERLTSGAISLLVKDGVDIQDLRLRAVFFFASTTHGYRLEQVTLAVLNIRSDDDAVAAYQKLQTILSSKGDYIHIGSANDMKNIAWERWQNSYYDHQAAVIQLEITLTSSVRSVIVSYRPFLTDQQRKDADKL